jgi:predicted MPP superfamily phosphohydrolase
MNRRTFLKSILFAGGASLAGGSAYALHSVDLDITRQEVPVKGIKQKMRIVALSDLHAPCYYISTPDLVSRINAENPDVLILAGDMFAVPDFEETITEFKNAKAEYAKLAVPGNWEYSLEISPAALKKAYAYAGIGYLVNDACEVGGLKIIGLDDLLLGSQNYRLAYDISRNALPGLIISHCPGSFDRIKSHHHNFKILISGHTHGGQIAPFGKVLVTPPGSGPYIQGWYHHGNNSMYVMRGVGASYLPLRIGARPELLVLDLIPALSKL